MSKRKHKNRGWCGSERPVLEPDAAGIDVGAREMYVAVPPDRAAEPVRVFGTFTSELQGLVKWLQECRITTVAMESTGVYWIPLFQLLEEAGIRSCLVNARGLKNVPGRRTDWHDCQWLQYLHAVGLLRAAFRPTQEICAVRSIWRQRCELVGMAAQHVQHMQKALTQMNLQIHHVISDITGVTGLAIVDAILAGERNPDKLALLREPSIQASPETIRQSLLGDWRREHLFVLQQSRTLYQSYREQIAGCDREIEALLGQLPPRADPNHLPPADKTTRQKKRTAGAISFDYRSEAYRLFGVDLTRIPGMQGTAMGLFSEIGNDLSRFPSAAHFASWLGLCPDNDKSGGQVLWRGVRKIQQRAGQLFRLSAHSLHRSQTRLGHFLRRMKAKLGPKAATTAAAHKLAVIFYTLVTKQIEYDESIWAVHEQENRQRMENRLKRQASRLGFQLLPLSLSVEVPQ
ncbi:MAG: IS110 family transposase [Deltaproteobacteria bacterium]|nr:IS110 family transposase [Deltaproteobacteria bacterium]